MYLLLTIYVLFLNIYFDVLFYEKWYVFWVAAMSNNFIHFFSKKRSAPALDIGIKVECSNNLCLKSRVLFCSMWSKKPDLCTYRSQAHKSWRPFLWRIAKKTCVKMLSWTKISFEKFYFFCDFYFWIGIREWASTRIPIRITDSDLTIFELHDLTCT